MTSWSSRTSSMETPSTSCLTTGENSANGRARNSSLGGTGATSQLRTRITQVRLEGRNEDHHQEAIREVAVPAAPSSKAHPLLRSLRCNVHHDLHESLESVGCQICPGSINRQVVKGRF